jgi:hypothetical protein
MMEMKVGRDDLSKGSKILKKALNLGGEKGRG